MRLAELGRRADELAAFEMQLRQAIADLDADEEATRVAGCLARADAIGERRLGRGARIDAALAAVVAELQADREDAIAQAAELVAVGRDGNMVTAPRLIQHALRHYLAEFLGGPRAHPYFRQPLAALWAEAFRGAVAAPVKRDAA